MVCSVGAVPLRWYKDEDHIGYDQTGHKILRKPKKDKLDQLLDRNDSKKVRGARRSWEELKGAGRGPKWVVGWCVRYAHGGEVLGRGRGLRSWQEWISAAYFREGGRCGQGEHGSGGRG